MCERPVDGILSLLSHVRSAQEHPPSEGERRRTSLLLRPLMEDLKEFEFPFDAYAEGPWWVGCDHLESPHRHGERVIPTLTCGHYRLRLPEVETAAQLAGYLSWRNVPEPPGDIRAY